MDYKEEYQKALERAKKGLPIDEVFPELKASKDERIIDDAIQIIRASRQRCAEYGAEADKHLKAISYLEKQKKQKPAEWSEEDNRHINTIIRAIHGAGNITPIEGELAEKWFKSLRPSWKPSEEQMDALEHFIRSWEESGTMSPQNPTLCAAKTLLNDLKKL